jgi:hypothetical protein
MAERLSGNQATQLGVESTPGTSVAANRKLLSTEFVVEPKAEVKTSRPFGTKYPTMGSLGKEWTEIKVSSKGNYTDIAYLLSSLVSYAAPTQQGGTAAYKWVFSSNPSAPDSVKTFTLEQGDANLAHKLTYGIMTGLNFSFGKEEIKFEGTMLGQAVQNNITMTSSPTLVAQQAMQSSQVDLYLADTQAGLAGASALSRSWAADFGLTERFTPIWPLGSAFGSGPAAILESATPKLVGKLSMEADSVGMGLLSKMRSGSQQFLRIKAVGPLIASTYYYTLQIDLSAVVTSPSPFKTLDNTVFAIDWNLEGVVDATWNKAFQIDLTTTVAAL